MSVVARQASFVGLVALGQTLVLLVGGIDLSVGAAAGLSAIVGSLLLTQTGIHPYAVLPLTALFGMMLGCINGCFVAVPAAQSLHRHAGLLGDIRRHDAGDHQGLPDPAAGRAIPGLRPGQPLRRSGPGHHLPGRRRHPDLRCWRAPASAATSIAIGGNREAAELVGIRTWRVEFLVFGLAGMFAALAGILYASRMDSGQPSVGEGWLMGAITAAIIGGTSLQRRPGDDRRHHSRRSADGSAGQRHRADERLRLLGARDRRHGRSDRHPGRSAAAAMNWSATSGVCPLRNVPNTWVGG